MEHAGQSARSSGQLQFGQQQLEPEQLAQQLERQLAARVHHLSRIPCPKKSCEQQPASLASKNDGNLEEGKASQGWTY